MVWYSTITKLNYYVADVIHGDNLYAIENLFREWRESAIVAKSDILNKAFEADSDLVELTPPSNEQREVDE